MTDESTPHDNDADSRPRIHVVAESKHGCVDVCVHGSEGESADDIADVADGRLEKALDAQEHLRNRDDDAEGVGVQ